MFEIQKKIENKNLLFKKFAILFGVLRRVLFEKEKYLKEVECCNTEKVRKSVTVLSMCTLVDRRPSHRSTVVIYR
jgi:hypothetical protein